MPQPVVDTVASKTDTVVSSTTLAIVINPVGVNMGLYVTIAFIRNNTQDVTGVTFAGVGLSLVARAIQTPGNDNNSEIWYWDPVLRGTLPTGSNNVVVTFSAAVDYLAVGAVALSGCLQTATQIGTAVTNIEYGAGSLSQSASSAAGEICLDCLSHYNETTVITPNAGQTQEININLGAAGYGIVLGVSVKDGAASVNMGWTFAATNSAALVIIPIKPAPAPVSPTIYRRMGMLAR